MIPSPTYISLDVPEPFAARVASLRRTFDPGFAHLPVEIAIAGSSGVGVISGDSTLREAIKIVNRLAATHLPITSRFSRAAWLSNLRVYALEVEAVAALVSLHEAVRRSGLTFSDYVPADFHPHCTLRWSPKWMNPDQDKAWKELIAPPGEFMLRDLVLYRLPPRAENAEVIHRATFCG